MTLLDLLRDDLAAAFGESPWHGPSFRALLGRFDAETAAAHPIDGAHSAWEIVLHVAAWMDAGARRLDSCAYTALPDAGDWPPVPAPADAAAWRRALRALDDAYLGLADRVGRLRPDDLSRLIVGAPSDALGGTVAHLVSGLTQHLAYHGGQLALLPRALRPTP